MTVKLFQQYSNINIDRFLLNKNKLNQLPVNGSKSILNEKINRLSFFLKSKRHNSSNVSSLIREKHLGIARRINFIKMRNILHMTLHIVLYDAGCSFISFIQTSRLIFNCTGSSRSLLSKNLSVELLSKSRFVIEMFFICP